MTKPNDLTFAQWHRAKLMYDDGMSATQIGRHFGVQPVKIRRRFDPKYQYKPVAVKKKRGPKVVEKVSPRIDTDNLEIVTADPLTITGRIFGDPPPGRSALDRRNSG